MTNSEILEKAINKAVDGGWNDPYPRHGFTFTVINGPLNDWKVLQVNFDSIVGVADWDVHRVIFNHNFAKALWGEDMAMFAMEDIKKDELGEVYMPGMEWWQYHLQNMVIALDPLQYLKDNMPDD